ncbi:MAG: Fic family protein [Alphaproteobacteria bacterium]|jgi:Fic family protein|nr:Fic family protein [Alphaproteobacteria bacterium]
MKYIWQHKEWPNFTWDNNAVDNKAYEYAMAANRLVGEVKHLSEDQKSEALIDLMVSEAIKTSQIEGENFDREDVRSSIRNQLGLNQTPETVKNSKANGIASLMISVREHFKAPLTAERLWEWQDKIIVGRLERASIEIGKWRSNPEPMQIVSGPYGKEKVHYEAPPSEQIDNEMTRFITWFNNSHYLKAAIRAGVAHLYFECIHPFSDGNGRIGRAISEIALSQELDHPTLLSLSTTIQNKRNEYYNALNKASYSNLDITEWLVCFINWVLDSQNQAKDQIDFVLSKARFWDVYITQLNERQHKVLRRMLREGPEGFKGGMSAQKYSKITDCSKATATRDLTDLLKIGAILKLEGGGRNTRYVIRLVGNIQNNNF